MKVFEVILEEGLNVYKAYGYAENEKELKETYGGNGEFVRIKDVTSTYLNQQFIDRLHWEMRKAGYGQTESDMVEAILTKALS